MIHKHDIGCYSIFPGVSLDLVPMSKNHWLQIFISDIKFRRLHIHDKSFCRFKNLQLTSKSSWKIRRSNTGLLHTLGGLPRNTIIICTAMTDWYTRRIIDATQRDIRKS